MALITQKWFWHGRLYVVDSLGSLERIPRIPEMFAPDGATAQGPPSIGQLYLCEGDEMQPTFSFSAELTGPQELTTQGTRRVLLTGHGIQMAIAGAMLVALAAAGTVWVGRDAMRQMQRNSALLQSGRQTQGTITQFQSPGTFEARVNYTFTAGGAAYTGEARVPGHLSQSLANSVSLPILYLPENPVINRPAGWQRSPRAEMALLVAPVVSALLGFLLFVPLFVERRMAAEGMPVLAIVTKCTRARHGFLLNYAFHLEDGTAVKGRGWYESWQEPGTGIWAIYLPRNPRRNLPYPLSYCRVIA